MNRIKTRLIVALAGCLMTALATSTQALSVAYINASGGSLGYLTGYGHTVTDINDPIGLTLGDLSGYDVVVSASNSIFTEPGNIGDVLADFADAGGGVVLTEFDFQGVWALSGRVMTAGYSPFTVDPLSGGYGDFSSLGTVYDASSPLLTGTAGATTQFEGDVGMNPGGVLVADWASGRHAVGYSQLANSAVVGLNLFPDQTWNTGAAGQQLVANAVTFSHPTTTVPDSGPSVVGLLVILGVCAFGSRHRQMRQTA